jgi:hypothetical protein
MIKEKKVANQLCHSHHDHFAEIKNTLKSSAIMDIMNLTVIMDAKSPTYGTKS